MTRPTRFRIVCFVCALFFVCCGIKYEARAANGLPDLPDLSDFGTIPVLHEGRVKTMENFARAAFYGVSGETRMDGVSALQWMAVTVFDPSKSVTMRVIYVPKLPILDLPRRQNRYYSLNEVMEAMRPHQELLRTLERQDPAMLGSSQKGLMKLYQGLVIYNQLIQSFSAVLPVNGFAGTYMDGAGSKAQRALIAAGGKDNTLLRFIPNDHPQTPLVSLWEAIEQDKGAKYIARIKEMAKAWNEGDIKAWEEISTLTADMLLGQSDDLSPRLIAEHYYTAIDPFLWITGLYVIGGMVVAFRYHRIALGLIWTGGIMHFLSLCARTYILSRPPTGTLYETFLFASFIVIAAAMLVFRRNRNALFAGGCAVCAGLILFISRGFTGGDSLNVLVAVLNTNFWLATHVTCIIIGYAITVMAALSGHLYLATDSRQIKNMMIPLALVALLFTAIGTLLGGIWADQSWGRFWGWDPKENGALLIVLWLAWVLHGRISGHFTLRGFAAALALTNITVGLTWFGVNLLGVGLHSYGFISGIAYGLGIFCAVQITVVAGLYLFHRQKVWAK